MNTLLRKLLFPKAIITLAGAKPMVEGKPIARSSPHRQAPGTHIRGVGDPEQLRKGSPRKRLVLCASRCIVVHRDSP
ncbi:hypothetical protein H5P28_03675 [Ruficoccus amylovorans]|uniref:Uncharacterized protein n=1 Tax=Ruficoccus amylovorans TaxID=1804625 RepID=A0A842HA28_9BACT|nr:hypothetical protein [Ruficoccus amylovorans]MBC2593353.1 hypothetical protein [Ruficoccus amylovorans]